MKYVKLLLDSEERLLPISDGTVDMFITLNTKFKILMT